MAANAHCPEAAVLAGALASALCARSLEEHWVRRIAGTRGLTVTPKGERIFRALFGVRL